MIHLIKKIFKKLISCWNTSEDMSVNGHYKYNPSHNKSKGCTRLVHGNIVWYDK